MTTALLVIDVQQSFAERPYFRPDGVADFLAAQNKLIAGFAAAGGPIVRVLHVEAGDDPADPFSLASGFVRPLEGLLAFEPALTVHKARHSALVGTGLEVWLTTQGVRRLVISGIRTEQCCETTARHASDLGYEVDFVPAATLTWDIPLPSGGCLEVPDLRERTAAVLRGRFARIVTVDAALEGLLQAVPADAA
jgi:nicotinamidase-related amidase